MPSTNTDSQQSPQSSVQKPGVHSRHSLGSRLSSSLFSQKHPELSPDENAVSPLTATPLTTETSAQDLSQDAQEPGVYSRFSDINLDFSAQSQQAASQHQSFDELLQDSSALINDVPVQSQPSNIASSIPTSTPSAPTTPTTEKQTETDTQTAGQKERARIVPETTPDNIADRINQEEAARLQEQTDTENLNPRPTTIDTQVEAQPDINIPSEEVLSVTEIPDSTQVTTAPTIADAIPASPIDIPDTSDNISSPSTPETSPENQPSTLPTNTTQPDNQSSVPPTTTAPSETIDVTSEGDQIVAAPQIQPTQAGDTIDFSDDTTYQPSVNEQETVTYAPPEKSGSALPDFSASPNYLAGGSSNQTPIYIPSPAQPATSNAGLAVAAPFVDTNATPSATSQPSTPDNPVLTPATTDTPQSHDSLFSSPTTASDIPVPTSSSPIAYSGGQALPASVVSSRPQFGIGPQASPKTTRTTFTSPESNTMPAPQSEDIDLASTSPQRQAGQAAQNALENLQNAANNVSPSATNLLKDLINTPFKLMRQVKRLGKWLSYLFALAANPLTWFVVGIFLIIYGAFNFLPTAMQDMLISMGIAPSAYLNALSDDCLSVKLTTQQTKFDSNVDETAKVIYTLELAPVKKSDTSSSVVILDGGCQSEGVVTCKDDKDANCPTNKNYTDLNKLVCDALTEKVGGQIEGYKLTSAIALNIPVDAKDLDVKKNNPSSGYSLPKGTNYGFTHNFSIRAHCENPKLAPDPTGHTQNPSSTNVTDVGDSNDPTNVFAQNQTGGTTSTGSSGGDAAQKLTDGIPTSTEVKNYSVSAFTCVGECGGSICWPFQEGSISSWPHGKKQYSAMDLSLANVPIRAPFTTTYTYEYQEYSCCKCGEFYDSSRGITCARITNCDNQHPRAGGYCGAGCAISFSNPVTGTKYKIMHIDRKECIRRGVITENQVGKVSSTISKTDSTIITAGTLIGTTDTSGANTGPHTHIQVYGKVTNVIEEFFPTTKNDYQSGQKIGNHTKGGPNCAW